MITKVPKNWKYDEAMEMLFLFYQRAEELLSHHTIDTYRLPAHNTMTLCLEIKDLFDELHNRAMLDEYYQRYISPIIDELICSIHDDYLLKAKLEGRLETIITGLEESKKNSKVIIKWIDFIFQLCTPIQYLLAYRNEIKRLITKSKNKKDLLYCEQVYFICLRRVFGYSMDHMYQTTMRFFANEEISDAEVIGKYLKSFSGLPKEIELNIVADCYLMESYESALSFFESNSMINSMHVLSEKEITSIANEQPIVDAFYKEYRRQRYGHNRTAVQMLSIKVDCLDPYCAVDIVNEGFFLLHCLESYFKHKQKSKVIFHCICKSEAGEYFQIKKSKVLTSRPYIDSETILSRIKLIWNERYMSRNAFQAIMQALILHDDAVTAKDENMILRTFWTATETLFAMPENGTDRDNVIHSLMYIVQKTYVLKVLRSIYASIIQCTDKGLLESELGIKEFSDFVLYYSKNKADSSEMKKLYAALRENVLLRTRIFNLRKELDDSKKVLEKLQKHEKKILWQLKRIYRARNLSTHAGITVDNVTYLVNNLHNYFDYALNFMLCKCENGDYVANVGTVVFEAKTDYSIFQEQLKNKQELNEQNCMSILFGPDQRLIDYNFEFLLDSRA